MIVSAIEDVVQARPKISCRVRPKKITMSSYLPLAASCTSRAPDRLIYSSAKFVLDVDLDESNLECEIS